MQLTRQAPGRMSLSVLFILLTSLLNIAFSLPLPQESAIVNALSARGLDPARPILYEEYLEYLKRYYPQTDRYLLYSGNSVEQLKAFQARNPGYYFYDDFFEASKSEHFEKAFPPENGIWRGDDADASSKAIAERASGNVKVFGAIEYLSSKGERSIYTNVEAPALLRGIEEKRVTAIQHMNRNAITPDDILATEEKKGEFKYTDPAKDKTNASCKRDGTSCGPRNAPEKPGTVTDKPVQAPPVAPEKPAPPPAPEQPAPPPAPEKPAPPPAPENPEPARPYGSGAVDVDPSGTVVDPNDPRVGGGKGITSHIDPPGKPVTGKPRFGRIP